MKKYEAIVFDFDGTIIDSQRGIARAFQQALATKNIEESIEVIQGLIGPPLTQTIIDKYGFTEEERDRAMKIHMTYYETEGLYESRIYDGVKEMFQAIKDKRIPLLIATNKPQDFAEKQLEHYGLDEYVDQLRGNDRAQKRGTKKMFIKEVLDEAKVSPEKALMVGDRDADLLPAKELGMDTAGVVYGYGSREEIESANPTYVLETPRELMEYL